MNRASSSFGGGAASGVFLLMTMRLAHLWLIDHFDEIESGAVVDVEFITGKTAAPKRSESEITS